MKRYSIYFILCACACMNTLPALSWGQEGHRIIAQIAYNHLSKRTQRNVDTILGKRGIVYWSNWPDEIKSDTIYPNSYDWHFQDFEGGLNDSTVLAALTDYPKEGGNLFRALDSLIAAATQRQHTKITRYNTEDIHTLRFIVHLTGDRYCPMHTAHLDDRGGNAVKMAWFSKHKNTNLHTVWDAKLIESQGYSFSEYAEILELRYADQQQSIEQMSEEELLLNNYHLTEAIYTYQQTWDGNTYHYIYRWHEPMERQLYIAGIRLAKVLNAIYR